jgi:hypothetical protein
VRQGYKLEGLLGEGGRRERLACGVHYWRDAGSILDWLLAHVHGRVAEEGAA